MAITDYPYWAKWHEKVDSNRSSVVSELVVSEHRDNGYQVYARTHTHTHTHTHILWRLVYRLASLECCELPKHVYSDFIYT